MKFLPFVIFSVMLSITGCAGSPKPYFEVGVGYKVNADWPFRPENAGGRNPTGHFEVGIEWKNKTRCGLNHWSHWRDGGPFNHRPETWKDEIVCFKKWGGQ